jgi:hypothetical protein
MDGRAFGAAYVNLDRIALHRLRESGQLATVLAAVERVLEPAVAADLKALCDAGCDREEILWLLKGAYAGPAFAPIERLFGRQGRALTSARESITNCADLIANINQHPFGILVSATVWGHDLLQLPARLREYASLIQEGSKAFRHGSHWYLHLTKARLVDHVRAFTGDVRDRQVSSLINAVLQPEAGYSEADQAMWRSRYYQDFSGLDPAVTWPAELRLQAARNLEAMTAEHPELKTVFDEALAAYVELLASRNPLLQKSAK